MAKTERKENKSEEKYWIGFDLGGTKMYSVVFDSEFNQVGKHRKKTKGFEGMDAGLKRINAVIQDSIEDAGIERHQVNGLGIGCPGPLDFEKGVIREAPNLGWTNVPIKKSVEQEFGFPVEIANDVDAGVFGEYRFGAGKNKRCVVGIFPGTGIGGGCVYEGRLFRGRNSSCMEIGHIPVLPGGPIDGVLNRGSLESVASRLAVAGQSAQAAYRGMAPKLLKSAGTDISDIRSGAIRESIQAGEKAIEEILSDACEYLGVAVVTIVHLMAPDLIVFGGGLIEAVPEFMLKNIEKAARHRIMPSLRDEFKIVEAELGDNAGVLGAAALAEQAFAVKNGQ